MGKAMGRAAGKKLMYQRFAQNLPDPRFPICFLYSSDRTMAEQVMEEMTDLYQLQDFDCRIYPVGGVIGTHVGTSCVGISYVVR